MDSESLKIIELLKIRASTDVKRSYEKNIHPSIIDMVRATQMARRLLRAVYTAGHINAKRTKALHSLCRRMMDSYYTFKERLEEFSSVDIKGLGVMVSPSFHAIDKSLIKARGASVHINEARYVYGTSKGPVSCSAGDNVIYAYDGECYSVTVEFTESNGSCCYSGSFDKLIGDVELSVNWTLGKFFEALNQRLP